MEQQPLVRTWWIEFSSFPRCFWIDAAFSAFTAMTHKESDVCERSCVASALELRRRQSRTYVRSVMSCVHVSSVRSLMSCGRVSLPTLVPTTSSTMLALLCFALLDFQTIALCAKIAQLYYIRICRSTVHQ